MSELEILCGSDVLMISFASKGAKDFEFVKFLTTLCEGKYDIIFYIDKHDCWYHKGIEGITTNIAETTEYIHNKIKRNNYKKVLFMGVSAGGYASILFGSLCSATHILAMIPQTILKNPINKQYKNLKKLIKPNIKYILYGKKNITNKHDSHHISQCLNITDFKNIELRYCDDMIPLEMIKAGVLQQVIIDMMELQNNI